jgi:hypothetical protein
VQVFSDHQNLKYFTTTKVLNRRQARWAQELAGIDFKIYYRPGSRNGKPDALSSRWKYRPENGGSENQPITTILHQKHFTTNTDEIIPKIGRISGAGPGTVYMTSTVQLSSIPTRQWTEEFKALVRQPAETDPEYRKGQEAAEQEAVQREAVPKDRKVREEAVGPCEAPRTSRKARSEGVLALKDGLLY